VHAPFHFYARPCHGISCPEGGAVLS
jgi:hypothetical protein